MLYTFQNFGADITKLPAQVQGISQEILCETIQQNHQVI